MKNFLHNTWKHRAHIVMALPAFLVLLFFAYIPMGGLVMAFKSYDYTKGIWGSPWNGLDNFKFLIASKSTFLSMTKNTLFYYVIFTGLGTVLNVVLAIAIDQCVFKKCAKTMQTVMIIPVFISYAAVQFIVYAFISTDTGILNNLFNARVRYYTTASYWPVILTIVKMWNSVGYGSVLYMSVLAGIDSSLYEAAEIDGAGTIKIFLTIMIPVIKPIMATVAIFSAVNQWNAFQDTLLLMTDTKLYPLQFILYQYLNQASSLKALANSSASSGAMAAASATAQTATSVRMTVTILVVAPIMFVYPIFQRYFVKGIMVGAVKG